MTSLRSSHTDMQNSVHMLGLVESSTLVPPPPPANSFRLTGLGKLILIAGHTCQERQSQNWPQPWGAGLRLISWAYIELTLVVLCPSAEVGTRLCLCGGGAVTLVRGEGGR